LLVSLTLGCEARRAAAPAPMTRADEGGARAPAAARMVTGGATAEADQRLPKGTALDSMVASRKLIRTGEMTIEVQSYEKAAQEATRLADSLGGYVADSRSSRAADGKEHGTLSIRVPAPRFAEALSGIKGLGTVRSQNVSAQDVTKAYTDLETRLRVKRDTADRLREILKMRTAGLSDVLQAERELARVTEEIEQLEGERRFYDQQIALSTLTLELDEPGTTAAESAFAPIGNALKDAARILSVSVASVVYIVAFLAPWLLIGGLLWLVVARSIRNRRKRGTTA
jgi:hypothetical protein